MHESSLDSLRNRGRYRPGVGAPGRARRSSGASKDRKGGQSLTPHSVSKQLGAPGHAGHDIAGTGREALHGWSRALYDRVWASVCDGETPKSDLCSTEKRPRLLKPQFTATSVPLVEPAVAERRSRWGPFKRQRCTNCSGVIPSPSRRAYSKVRWLTPTASASWGTVIDRHAALPCARAQRSVSRRRDRSSPELGPQFSHAARALSSSDSTS